MTEWLAMGGNAPFVWGSYAVTALVLVIEMIALRARRRAAASIVIDGDRR